MKVLPSSNGVAYFESESGVIYAVRPQGDGYAIGIGLRRKKARRAFVLSECTKGAASPQEALSAWQTYMRSI